MEGNTRVVIGSDAAGMPLKELVKETLIEDGPEVAKKIAREFLKADYAAGRHQIRVDMLNKMA